jgi:hypothetical protein
LHKLVPSGIIIGDPCFLPRISSVFSDARSRDDLSLVWVGILEAWQAHAHRRRYSMFGAGLASRKPVI